MGSAAVSAILHNYRSVIEQVEQAAGRAGRDPKTVRLVVVTKGHPVFALREAVAAGIRVFGENYAEEAVEKIQVFESPSPLEWHMIGHIQSRKAGLVAAHFQWVHSVDSLKLANRLDRFAGEGGKRLPVLLECNVSGESSKFGWQAWEESRWPNLLPEIADLSRLQNLELRGLMTMAPFFDSPEPARPYFHRLRSLRDYLAERLTSVKLDELSMGMSGDFMVAVEEGATLVRIGTAIMGPGQQTRGQIG